MIYLYIRRLFGGYTLLPDLVQIVGDLFPEVAIREISCKFTSTRKPFCVCTTVAFHGDTAKTQQHTTIYIAGVHLFAQLLQAANGQYRANLGKNV